MAGDVEAEKELSRLDAPLRHADEAMLKAKQAGKRQVSRLDRHGEIAPFVGYALIRRRLFTLFETRAFSLHHRARAH